MKQHILSIIAASLFISSVPVMAQDHFIPPFAVGVRGTPYGAGLNLRYYPKDYIIVEGQLNLSAGTQGGSGKSTMGVVLLEGNARLGQNLRFFAGPGLMYGNWEQYRDKSKSDTYVGYCLAIGAEWAFTDVPFSVSIDARPGYISAAGTYIFPNDTWGLALRYRFGNWETTYKKQREHRYRDDGDTRR